MLWLLLISAILYLTLLGVLIYYAHHASEGPGEEFANYPPLSIIVAARNEENHLEEHLTAILEQEYPQDFELCLVLDRCTDRSLEIARSLVPRYPHLRILEIKATESGWAPKKWALTQAINSANNEQLVFTDADCLPEKGWLKRMGALLGAGSELVFGLGPYHKKPGILNALIRYETWYTAVQYVAWAVLGKPYMAVGRNLAYTKEFFQRAGGFEAHKTRMSGDDDLLVNAAAEGITPGLNLAPDGKVYSEPETTLRDWIRQKLRHLSAGSAYRPGSLLILSVFHGLHAIFYISLTLVLYSTPWTLEALGIYLARTIIAWIGLALLANKWNFNTPMLWFPLLDILYFFYNLIMVPASLFHKPKWKGN